MKLANKILEAMNIQKISEGSDRKPISFTATKASLDWRGWEKKTEVEFIFDRKSAQKDVDKVKKKQLSDLEKRFKKIKNPSKDDTQEYEEDKLNIELEAKDKMEQYVDDFNSLGGDNVSASRRDGQLNFDLPNQYIRVVGGADFVDELPGNWEYDGGEVSTEKEDEYRLSRF